MSSPEWYFTYFPATDSAKGHHPPCPPAAPVAGPLMAAFLNYIMSAPAQAQLPGLGFGAVPTTVIAYSVQRALPLLSVDTSQVSTITTAFKYHKIELPIIPSMSMPPSTSELPMNENAPIQRIHLKFGIWQLDVCSNLFHKFIRSCTDKFIRCRTDKYASASTHLMPPLVDGPNWYMIPTQRHIPPPSQCEGCTLVL